MAEGSRIEILQWNIFGLKSKAHHVKAAAAIEGIDIFLIQETRMTGSDYSLAGFQTFLLPRTEGRGELATLVRNTIPATKIASPPDCGGGNEVLGVRIKTKNNEVALYNVYRNQNVDFNCGGTPQCSTL